MLEIDYTSRFERDVKALARKHYDISLLKEVVSLVSEDTADSRAILRQRHNMHAERVAQHMQASSAQTQQQSEQEPSDRASQYRTPRLCASPNRRTSTSRFLKRSLESFPHDFAERGTDGTPLRSDGARNVPRNHHERTARKTNRGLINMRCDE